MPLLRRPHRICLALGASAIGLSCCSRQFAEFGGSSHRSDSTISSLPAVTGDTVADSVVIQCPCCGVVLELTEQGVIKVVPDPEVEPPPMLSSSSTSLPPAQPSSAPHVKSRSNPYPSSSDSSSSEPTAARAGPGAKGGHGAKGWLWCSGWRLSSWPWC